MSHDAVSALFDEVCEFVASVPGRHPHWSVCSETSHGAYAVTVVVGGEIAADVGARELGAAHRKALTVFRAWASDQPSEIAHALEVTLETARTP